MAESASSRARRRAPAGYDPHQTIRRYMRMAVGVCGVLLVGGAAMASVITVAGAVIAPGQLTLEGNVRTIKHPTGGVVAEIDVQDGDHVKAGQLLVGLDPVVMGANVAIVSDAINEASAKQARLEAERDGRATAHFPAELQAQGATASARTALRDESQLMRLRTQTREGEKSQLRERKVQLQNQIEGFRGEIAAKQNETALIDQELVNVRKLYDRNLVPLSRLNALERQAVQLHGDVAQLSAAIAEARGKISETELQILHVDETGRSEAGAQLGEVQNQLAELRQKQVAASQEFKRVNIRAPQDGVVDKLSAHTVGGVIGPGEQIMLIVPERDRLHVQVHVRPVDIDKVHVGQRATLRFSAFSARTTPEIEGVVARVSPDLTAEERTGQSYYVADIDLPPAQLERLKGLKLLAGMPVESFIETRARSMLSYLVKPLGDQLKRAFRDT